MVALFDISENCEIERQNLIDKKYPTTPSEDLYLIFEIESDVSMEFNNVLFDLKKLPNYASFRNSPKPITVSLTELLKK